MKQEHKSDQKIKSEGLWCDFCGKKHAGRCEKVTTTNTEQILKEFDEKELNQLEWCGNEDHECDCYQKTDAIKQFIVDKLASQKQQILDALEKREKRFKEIYGGQDEAAKERYRIRLDESDEIKTIIKNL